MSLQLSNCTVLCVRGLVKWYGSFQALRGVDLQIDSGEVVALMGPNGSGKSTLIKSIVGLVHPDEGNVTILGRDTRDGIDYRRTLGYMPQIARYPETLAVGELFRMLKELRHDCSTHDSELYEQLGVVTFEHKQLGTLSGGQRQRVSAALAFYFCPLLLLLDEPTAGLDPFSTETIKAKIRAEKRQGRSFLITTHSPQDTMELADRLVYLYDGSICIDAPLESVLGTSPAPSLMGAIAWHLQHRVGL
jgi:Cu-processing system ATP-binding protein